MSDYITIQLTKGYETTIDSIDADLALYKWCTLKRRGRCYAIRSYSFNGKMHYELLHRVILTRILGRPLEKGEIVDHIDNDQPLDNRRSNIRLATHSQNISNSRMRDNNKSGYKGVTWVKSKNKWRAEIMVNYKHIHLGYFTDIKEAAKAYADASIKYHGEFGRLE